ncbi:hypothetical protein [Ensifer aridi]|uniref:hypothetical protein n=1 Tax=Ensifer aridi TaxID=1708715 RepID=UPI001AECA785|nr:hypothetical protein [Ensifer aridi]
MAAEEIPTYETELAMQLRTRGLVRTVADRGSRRLDNNHSALIETLATILNATDAPPIDLHIEEALAELNGPRFFLVQHILCDLIPLLNVELDVLISFVERLLDAGGNDLAADAPSTAFGEWTKKDPIRPPKVYEAACSGEKLALRQLFTVLRMNADAEQALMFARADERELKLAAISALGAMELDEHYGKVFDILLQEASSDDEDTALRSLEAGYRAAAQRKASAPAGFDEQLGRVLQTRSPLAVHFAANLLWVHREGLTENAIDLCLAAVTDVNPDNTGTISHIDQAAYRLVGAGRAEHVVRLLGELIDRSKGRITLDAFQSTYHALQNAGSDVLGGAVVYWLLNGGTYTRKCVANEVCGVGNDTPPFSIPKSSLPPDPSDQLFLCRKAVGWFFIDPLAAVAIPLAVLRDGSPDIANDVLEEHTRAGILYTFVLAWLAIMGDQERAERLRSALLDHAPHMTHQIWVPDRRTDEVFWDGDRDHGLSVPGLPLNESLEAVFDLLNRVMNEHPLDERVSAVRIHLTPMLLTACRHYRMPVPVHIWQGQDRSSLDSAVSERAASGLGDPAVEGWATLRT